MEVSSLQYTVYDYYLNYDQDVSNFLSSEDKVMFNGVSFSDSEFFTEGKIYYVVDSETIGFYVLGNEAIELFIFPDGLSSFIKLE